MNPAHVTSGIRALVTALTCVSIYDATDGVFFWSVLLLWSVLLWSVLWSVFWSVLLWFVLWSVFMSFVIVESKADVAFILGTLRIWIPSTTCLTMFPGLIWDEFSIGPTGPTGVVRIFITALALACVFDMAHVLFFLPIIVIVESKADVAFILGTLRIWIPSTTRLTMLPSLIWDEFSIGPTGITGVVKIFITALALAHVFDMAHVLFFLPIIMLVAMILWWHALTSSYVRVTGIVPLTATNCHALGFSETVTFAHFFTILHRWLGGISSILVATHAHAFAAATSLGGIGAIHGGFSEDLVVGTSSHLEGERHSNGE